MRVLNVLFLCTGNSARSIMAEAILNKEGDGKFKAYSAGSMPKGAVHPLSLKVLASYGYPLDGLASKNWGVFAAADAPRMDFVFTVCDNAAGEACPLWPGQPITAHWGIEDPAAVEGSEAERHFAFADTHRMLYQRIGIFTNLPLASLDKLSLQKQLDEIGRSKASAPERA